MKILCIKSARMNEGWGHGNGKQSFTKGVTYHTNSRWMTKDDLFQRHELIGPGSPWFDEHFVKAEFNRSDYRTTRAIWDEWYKKDLLRTFSEYLSDKIRRSK